MLKTAQLKEAASPVMRTALANVASFEEDGKLLAMAREIAMDILPIETIIANYGMTAHRFAVVRELPRFQQYVEHEILVWGTSLNASQRVKVKSISLIEEWLVHLNSEMHAATSTLASKVEAGKLVARLAGLGLNVAEAAGQSEQFSVTINMGDDRQVKIGRVITAAQTGKDEYGTPLDEDGYSYSAKGGSYSDKGGSEGTRGGNLHERMGRERASPDPWASTGDKWASVIDNNELG